MIVKELIDRLTSQPPGAVVQPGDDETLYIFDNQLGIVDQIEL